MRPLAGRVVVVTGASSGLGRAAALALAAGGAQLVLAGRDAGRLDDAVARADAAAAAAGHDRRAFACRADVASEADMQRLAAETLARFGRIDALVHSAGVLRAPGAPLRAVADMPTAEWDGVLDTNLRGTWLANRAVLPAMRAQGEGDIVNLTSLSGHTGRAFDAPYCASKFGVVGLTRALAEEVGPDGVRVQALAPGRFDTEVLAQIGLPQGGHIPPPSRVADCIRWLLELPPDLRLADPLIAPLDTAPPAALRGQPYDPKLQERPMTSTSLFGTAPDLRGKVVVITGGTGGIGLATAKAVRALGASVVVADLDGARVAALADELHGAHAVGGAAGLAVDVRVEADLQAMAALALERFGRIDALICCAGILRKRGTPPKLLVDTTTDEFDDVVGINLKGIFLANRAVLPTMIAQRGGLVVNVSSVQGLQGRAYDSVYCASKFGVVGFSQAVADEVKSYGVKVQALMPGAVATPMWEQNLPAPMPGDAVPPERIADVIVFMLLQPEDTQLVAPVVLPVGARRRRAKAAAGADPTGTP